MGRWFWGCAAACFATSATSKMPSRQRSWYWSAVRGPFAMATWWVTGSLESPTAWPFGPGARGPAVRPRSHRAGLRRDSATAAHVDDSLELRSILDEELERLPASLRSPVILCYLEGLTHDEAAQRLRWPVGTVRSRMARARDLLRRRLSRRGVTAEASILPPALARPSVPSDWIVSTVKESLAFAATKTTVAGQASAAATLLARGVLHAMMLSKVKTLGVVAIAAALTLGGVQTLARQHGGATQESKPAQASPGESTRREALIRSVEKVSGILEDLEGRNRDLQKEVQALRDEITKLRAGISSVRTDPGPTAATTRKDVRFTRADNDPTKNAAAAAPAGLVAAKETGPPPQSFENGAYLYVISSQGDRIAAFNRTTGETRAIELPAPAGVRHEASLIWGNGVVAVNLKGPKISRIAVHCGSNRAEAWYPLDLREPVDNASPIVGNRSAVYVLGRDVYAFSASAKSWDILELPAEDMLRQGTQIGGAGPGGSYTVRHGSHVYVFDLRRGKWKDIDLNAILKGGNVDVDNDPAPATVELQ